MAISPLNYPGNKAKILGQILDILPKGRTDFVDVFCGSGMVGLNSDCPAVFSNDLSPHSIELLRFFIETPTDEIIAGVERVINDYGLTYSRIVPKGTYVEHKHEGLSLYNKAGFEKLKDDYNADKSTLKLFVLAIYGFNHYLRFNGKDAFNVPVGKVDFCDQLYRKTIAFSNLAKTKSVALSSLDFRTPSLYDHQNAIFYFDPPYLITSAPYNGNWSERDEHDLIDLLDLLDAQGKQFGLSNVLVSNGKTNAILTKWANKYNIHQMKRQYRNANYRRKNASLAEEVLITNF